MSRREAKPRTQPRPRRARASLAILLLLGLVFSVFGAACAHDTRYRVLKFFFDGVPEPGEETVEPDLPEATDDLRLRQFDRTDSRFFVHTAVRRRLCNQCHRMSSSGMESLAPEQGACRQCHTSPPAGLRFVHGPVAVNACLECHHYHQSSHPGFALEGPKTLCYRCHDQEDLSTGEHHAAVNSEAGAACTECHDPHGGDDRFFLKRRDQK